MAVDRETLISRLETLCTKACGGDTEAIDKIRTIKDSAAAGDPRAKQALAGLRHLYWCKQADTVAWNHAEAIYRETARKNPQAKLVVQTIIDRANSGDPVATATWGRLKAIHGSTQPGALFPAGPGQARIGGYGMPAYNRAGVVVGNSSNIGQHELIGGLPVRNRAGLVVGRRVIVGGPLTSTQTAELRDLMERAARARVAFQVSSAAKRAIKQTTTMGPSVFQKEAILKPIRQAALKQTITNAATSRYGTAASYAAASNAPVDPNVLLADFKANF